MSMVINKICYIDILNIEENIEELLFWKIV